MMPKQRELLSAALRHVRDAESLLADSPDQTWHLAGFGPECARKACLHLRWADMAIGHRLDREAEGLVQTAIALDPHGWRYHLEDWGVRWPVLEHWTPEARYQQTGSVTHSDATGLARAAREALTKVVVDLWADGLLDTPEI